MKYENKWHLNEGQDIPDNADKLTKDGAVVAYRLPIRQIEVGDTVKRAGSPEHTVLYIHHIDPSRRFVVYAFGGDMPKSAFSCDLTLVEKAK
jgi:hypothetical protein